VHPCVSTTASQGGGKELAEGIAPVVGQKPTPGSNDEAPLLYTDEGYLESWARTLLGVLKVALLMFLGRDKLKLAPGGDHYRGA